MESDQVSTGTRKEGLDMWYAGIDLHRRTAVVALLDDSGRRVRAKSFQCGEPGRIVEHLRRHRPFKAAIESSCYTRWLYDLLSAEGKVVMAHPLKLRAIWWPVTFVVELEETPVAATQSRLGPVGANCGSDNPQHRLSHTTIDPCHS